MIKFFGMIMIIAACTASGILMSQNRKKVICYVEALIYLVRHIKYKITYFRSEIKEIYYDFSNDFLSKCGFIRMLTDNSLMQVINEYSDKFTMREYEYNAVYNLACSLGKSSWEDQVEICSSVIEILEKYHEELNLKYPDERKLFSSLGVIAGLLIAVVLV